MKPSANALIRSAIPNKFHAIPTRRQYRPCRQDDAGLGYAAHLTCHVGDANFSCFCHG
jgi:hypothetical protein